MASTAALSQKAVVALAGRRIDPVGSKVPRFPLDHIAQVRADLHSLFKQENVVFLVCSAACGADLIALDVARKKNIQFRIILPFSVERFRQSSVIDRPGDWGPLFDQIIKEIPQAELVVVPEAASDDEAYERANEEIVRQAREMASPETAFAIAVWEGRPRKEGDATASFLDLAKSAGMKIRTVSSC